MASCWINLPSEILVQIARILSTEHHPSLLSFGLVCTVFDQAALSSSLHTIKFDITSPRKCRRQVKRTIDLLSSRDGFKYVRNLEIKGYMHIKSDDDANGETESDDDGGRKWQLNDYNYYGEDEIYGLDDPERYLIGFDRPSGVSLKVDEAWLPLANFIQQISSLKTLNWKCNSQFPPCLLKALLSHQPQCKLNLLKFRFASLHESGTDPHELALATCPLLHAVSIRYSNRDSKGQDDFNEEACLQMVSSMAPNLVKAKFVRCRPVSSSALMRSRTRPRETWQGFRPAQKSNGMCRLSSLELVGVGQISADTLRSHAVSVDFSALRVLSLNRGITGEGMAWANANLTLPRLEEVYVVLDRDDESGARPGFEDTAAQFLTALPPLRTLCVFGSFDQSSFSAAIKHHGPKLLKLEVNPCESSYSRTRRYFPLVLGKSEVHEIGSHCPSLQDLAIPVPRAKSGPDEVAMYRSIGQLGQLRKLFLTLDCSNLSLSQQNDDDAQSENGNEQSEDPTFDEIDREPFRYGMGVASLKKGHLRDAFINSAVDETLARSIWNTIGGSSPTSHIQELKITTQGGANFGSNAMEMNVLDMMHHLSRSFMLQRSVRDDSDEVTIKELGRRAREARDASRLKELRESGNQQSNEALKVFRRIWPPKEGSRSWRDDWQSFPLET